MLELILKEEQSRFAVKSAGMDPSGRIDPGLKEFLRTYETEEVDLETLQSTPISVALDDHVKLVAYVSEEVRRESPIIATTGETLTLETDALRAQLEEADDPEEYRKALETLRETTVPEILESLGLNS